MDKLLFGSIILGIMGVTVSIGLIITTYNYSLIMKPIDSDIIVGFLAQLLLLGSSIIMFNFYVRSETL